MAPISSWMRLVSRSIWTPSASMWSRSILASSTWWSSKRLAGASHGRSSRRPAGLGRMRRSTGAEADNQVLQAESLTSTTCGDAVGTR
jgi:hypothetical protein